jgi:hypothetical protein
MKTFLLFLALVSATAVNAEERVYSGTWKTTNRSLDGAMTCIIRPQANDKWQGRFFGTWQGVNFDYKVDFQGPPDDLRGTATIDGVMYRWRGRIDSQRFRANFGGDRYRGSFDLRRTLPSAVAARP